MFNEYVHDKKVFVMCLMRIKYKCTHITKRTNLSDIQKGIRGLNHVKKNNK